MSKEGRELVVFGVYWGVVEWQMNLEKKFGTLGGRWKGEQGRVLGIQYSR